MKITIKDAKENELARQQNLTMSISKAGPFVIHFVDNPIRFRPSLDLAVPK